MDRLKKLYKNYLNELLTEYNQKLEDLSEWKLDSYLPNSNCLNKMEKIKLIQEKFLSNDIIYSTLIEDFNQLNNINFEPTALKILSINDRHLEASGYIENKKERVYSFISEVQKLIKE